MNDGRDSRRRVVTGRKLSDGKPVAVVLEATQDGDVAAFRAGVSEAVLFDTAGVDRMVRCLRELQAVTLRGTRWDGIK